MKRFCSTLLVIIFLFSIFTTEVNAKGFPDLPSWASKEILHLNKGEIVVGLPNGTFGSVNSISRGDAALMLARAKKLNVDGINTGTDFPDVTEDMYYYEAIQAAVHAGYLNGYPDGTFGPMDTLTREQMAKIIAEAYDLTGKAGSSFSDTSASWAKYEIEALVVGGISNGLINGSFQPKSNITRAEFSVMLARAMNNDFRVESLKNMKAHFIDVGQGDSTLIQTPDGANILIDGGIPLEGAKVVDYLKFNDVEKLDLVIATHPHYDHIGGLISVFNNIPVDKVIDSGRTYTTKTYYDYIRLIDQKNIPMEVPRVGQVYAFDNDIKFTVLHVDSEAPIVNNASLVFKIEYGDVSIMLTGDAERDAEAKLATSKLNLKSKVLKAGHHGSSTSSIAEFINLVKPNDVIFSNEKGHIHGHPHASVVKRFRAMGAKMHTTNDGDIMLIANGTTYSISATPWVASN